MPISKKGFKGGFNKDDDPDFLTFEPILDAEKTTIYQSPVKELTGIRGSIPVTISGDASVQYRVANDAAFTDVVIDWTMAPGHIKKKQFIQLRMTSSNAYNTEKTVNLVIGVGTFSWIVKTKLEPGTVTGIVSGLNFNRIWFMPNDGNGARIASSGNDLFLYDWNNNENKIEAIGSGFNNGGGGGAFVATINFNSTLPTSYAFNVGRPSTDHNLADSYIGNPRVLLARGSVNTVGGLASESIGQIKFSGGNGNQGGGASGSSSGNGGSSNGTKGGSTASGIAGGSQGSDGVSGSMLGGGGAGKAGLGPCVNSGTTGCVTATIVPGRGGIAAVCGTTKLFSAPGSGRGFYNGTWQGDPPKLVPNSYMAWWRIEKGSPLLGETTLQFEGCIPPGAYQGDLGLGEGGYLTVHNVATQLLGPGKNGGLYGGGGGTGSPAGNGAQGAFRFTWKPPPFIPFQIEYLIVGGGQSGYQSGVTGCARGTFIRDIPIYGSRYTCNAGEYCIIYNVVEHDAAGVTTPNPETVTWCGPADRTTNPLPISVKVYVNKGTGQLYSPGQGGTVKTGTLTLTQGYHSVVVGNANEQSAFFGIAAPSGGGGAGTTSSISGSPVLYGKSGEAVATQQPVNNPGWGGNATTDVPFVGSPGTVIIRYPGYRKADGGNVITYNGYTIHIFTASGQLRVW